MCLCENFQSPDAVELALNLHGACLGDRELRISRILQKKKLANSSFSNQNKRNNFSQKQKVKTIEPSYKKNPFQGTKFPDKKMKKQVNEMFNCFMPHIYIYLI